MSEKMQNAHNIMTGRSEAACSVAWRGLSLTPTFRWVEVMRPVVSNRFSGLPVGTPRPRSESFQETAEAVDIASERPDTLLKQGVNERAYRTKAPRQAGFGLSLTPTFRWVHVRPPSFLLTNRFSGLREEAS